MTVSVIKPNTIKNDATANNGNKIVNGASFTRELSSDFVKKPISISRKNNIAFTKLENSKATTNAQYPLSIAPEIKYHLLKTGVTIPHDRIIKPA